MSSPLRLLVTIVGVVISTTTTVTVQAATTFYSDMGFCEKLFTRERRCAMQPSDCIPTHSSAGESNVEGESWVTAVRAAIKTPLVKCDCDNTPTGLCVPNDQLDKVTPSTIGQQGVNYRCAASSHLCNQEEETFLFVDFPLDQETGAQCGCNGLFNQDGPLSKDGSASLYGACVDSNYNLNDVAPSDAFFCAYSPEACSDGHEWVEPTIVKSSLGLECHCESVRVGGCLNGLNGFHCANTADDCGSWGNYLPPLPLLRDSGESCRLCESTASTLPDEIDAIIEAGGGGSSSGIGAPSSYAPNNKKVTMTTTIGVVVGLVWFM